ncbi:hypothetical protein SSS_09732 [Sarcoptes scabiei]|uniref:Uncharacterized protein n=1 Tax=Sarcoptes scabiei TaxID=52283 RepID=A0A834VIK9_SARSC|nr:hypothetical protein SSS_09732 [Sarcoptes scabiei]
MSKTINDSFDEDSIIISDIIDENSSSDDDLDDELNIFDDKSSKKKTLNRSPKKKEKILIDKNDFPKPSASTYYKNLSRIAKKYSIRSEKDSESYSNDDDSEDSDCVIDFSKIDFDQTTTRRSLTAKKSDSRRRNISENRFNRSSLRISSNQTAKQRERSIEKEKQSLDMIPFKIKNTHQDVIAAENLLNSELINKKSMAVNFFEINYRKMVKQQSWNNLEYQKTCLIRLVDELRYGQQNYRQKHFLLNLIQQKLGNDFDLSLAVEKSFRNFLPIIRFCNELKPHFEFLFFPSDSGLQWFAQLKKNYIDHETMEMYKLIWTFLADFQSEQNRIKS